MNCGDELQRCWGRSAEEVVFSRISTGASDDIQKVTSIAERMVTLYGMDTTLGPVAFEQTQNQFLGGQSTRRAIGPEVTVQIDREVKAIVDNAHAIAQNILITNRDLLEDLAQRLLQNEVLEGPELREYLQRAQAPAEVSEWLCTGKLTEQ